MSEPVLRQPDQTKPFEVEDDASNYAMGAVLMQRDEKCHNTMDRGLTQLELF